jgi:transcription elongation GreA/GreB family factor
MMSKEHVVEAIRERLLADLESLSGYQRSAQSGATHEEARAEADTDMRATEASYLARGLSERVAQLSHEAAALRAMPLRAFGKRDRIAVGALVALRSDEHGLAHYLVTPVAGGVRVPCGGTEVTSVTPSAPLGRALIGQRCDDEIELDSPRGRIVYEIVEVR